jgi:large subunit ribosomal protein L23
MELKDVLKKPLITEKMNAISEKFNRAGFIVDRRANKLEIKKAIKLMYGVEPIEVNTSILPGKAKSRYTKSGYTKGNTQARKKAVVTLAEGDTIDFFNNI